MQSQEPLRKRRLKDSCNSCAASKVKCSKNKPICTRCEDRGISCQYVPSQRSGRRSTPSTIGASPLSATITPPPEPSHFNSLKSRSGTVTPSSLALETNLEVQAVDNSEFTNLRIGGFDSEFSPQWATGILSTPNTDGSVFGSTVLSPLATTRTYTPISNPVFGSINHSLETSQESVLPAGFDDVDYYPGEFSKSLTPPPERPHSCLSLALDILPILYIPPTTCTLVSVSPSIHESFTIDYIISTNKKIIESISLMLDCPCSLDGQLPFILALITFQILAWYDAAVKDFDSTWPSDNPRQASEQSLHIPIMVRNYQLGGFHDKRMRAQLILSELNRVVRLVELLSKRFKEARARAGVDVSTHNSGFDAGGIKIGRLSASILVQLEADMKQRLQAVAKDTMAILRSG
ncbi:hypothetical protein MMC22_003428 [Lobaria immixta]|nr:hypothetical protein [Lobaria immixta]